MRRLLLALALNGFLGVTSAYAQTPPCNAGVHSAEAIIPLRNGNTTYCISSYGWSDTWYIGNPATANLQDDLLSGDDAFNLKYDRPTGGLGSSSGWLSPSLDQGTLSAQDSPGFASRPWTVVTDVHSTGSNTTQSVIRNADGLEITIDAFAPPGTFGVQIALTIHNTSATAITGVKLADYFNFHPNGSFNNLNFTGVTKFLNNCIVTTSATPTLNGSMCGQFAPVNFEVGLAYVPQAGTPPAVWQDVGNGSYNNLAGPVGPDDSAGALQWNLPDIAPGQSVRFAVGKNLAPFTPPALSKAFVPATIPVNGTSVLTFTLANNNTLPLTGVGFTDTLPGSVVTVSAGGTSAFCGGTLTLPPVGGNAISVSGATIPASGSCSFSVTVTSSVGGAFVNTTGPVSSNEGGNGPPAIATLIVAAPPVISKSFNLSRISVGGTSTLTFMIQNPNVSVTLTGVGFTDPLPSGVAVAATPNLTNLCGGTATGFTAGSTSLSLTGVTLAGSGSCTVTVAVVGNTIGTKNNVTSPVTSNEAGNGNTASATLVVLSPPSISKGFNPSQIPVGGTSTLTFTLMNPNPSPATLTGIGFTDPLPPGVAVAATPALTNTCGGTATGFTAGSTNLSLAGVTLAGGTSCTISVVVIGNTAGVKNNATTAVTSIEAGNGNSATAVLTVVAPPSISKAFNPSTVPVGGISTLTLTLVNPNSTVALTGVGFTDPLPPGVVVAPTPNLTNGCGGTPAGFTAGSGSLGLTSVTLAPSATCTISVAVVGSTPGVKNNTTSVVSSAEGGNGNSATSTLTVVAPPVISKAFSPSPIPINGVSTLTLTIVNPNSFIALTGIGFTDPLPAGLSVAATPNLTNTCGGTLTGFTVGSTNLSLTGASLGANLSCTISVAVVGTTAGSKVNVTTQVTSNEGGLGNTATATLVVGSLNISKIFTPASIPLNTGSTLTFAITNSTLFLNTGVSFTDPLPAGVTVASPSGASTTCGGTVTAAPGSGLITFAGGSVAAGTQCNIAVNVLGTTAGVKVNTTTPVTSTEGGTGGTATANLTVVAPPSITKAFNPSTVPVNGMSTLTLTITNPNTFVGGGLTGVGFTDVFPANVIVATPNGVTSTCGGTLTATAGSGSVTLAGATLATGASCTISVKVQATASGVYVNTTGSVTSIEGGNGNTATSTLTVPLPPSISKAFSPKTIPINGTSVLTFTVRNQNPTTTLTGVGVIDTLPANVLVSTPNGIANGCGGALSAPAAGATITLSGVTLLGAASCTFSVNVTSSIPGSYTNLSNPVTSIEGGPGNTATDTLIVGIVSPFLSKGFGEVSIGVKGITTLTFVLTNPNNNRTLTQVAFSDTFPAGLLIANPNAPTTPSCNGGTITAVSGTNVVSLSGATFAPLATCTFTVNITGVTPGPQHNVTTVVTSLEAPPGDAAVADLFVGDAYQITYDANLNAGDSLLDITNTGASGASFASGTAASVTGAICANVYVFSPDEQMISCCSCPVTPNGLVSLSANTDLISNTLTPSTPTSIVVKVLGSLPVGNSCTNSAGSVTPQLLANGLAGFNTTLHMTPTGAFAPTEKRFSGATLSAGELTRLTSLCNFIISNGSGFGVCRACRLGGLGGDRQ